MSTIVICDDWDGPCKSYVGRDLDTIIDQIVLEFDIPKDEVKELVYDGYFITYENIEVDLI